MNSSRRPLAPLAGEIYAALGRHRRSLGDLALSTGISESTLRRRLEHPGKLTLDELSTIAHDLKVPPSALTAVLSEAFAS